jgi:ketosteroid isomerase-like protein
VTPAEVCRSYLGAFAEGDPDVIAAHVTEDFVNEHTAALGSSCVGRDVYRERLPGFLASLTGLRYEVEDVIADGDRVAAAYVLHAQVEGRPIRIRGMMRLRVVGDRVAHRVDYWDSLVFQRQAGLA